MSTMADLRQSDAGQIDLGAFSQRNAKPTAADAMEVGDHILEDGSVEKVVGHEIQRADVVVTTDKKTHKWNRKKIVLKLVAGAAALISAATLFSGALVNDDSGTTVPTSDRVSVSAPAVVAPVRTPAPTTAAGYRAMWDKVDTAEWGAADVSLSFEMPDGRVVWLYGDTFSGRNGFVHSTGITQDGGALHVSHGGQQLLPNDDKNHIYWIEAGKAVGPNTIEVTAAPTTIGDSGVWDFKRGNVQSRVAIVKIDAAGNLTFDRWKGYTDAPAPFTDFKVIGPHHFTYEKRAHPEAELASGKMLYTVNQNWDDDIRNHMENGHLRYSDYRPIFFVGQAPK